MEAEEKTIDQRGEDYANNTRLATATYKGDVVTAYVIGAMDEKKLHKANVARLLGLLYAELNERRDWSASKAYETAIELVKAELK